MFKTANVMISELNEAISDTTQKRDGQTIEKSRLGHFEPMSKTALKRDDL